MSLIHLSVPSRWMEPIAVTKKCVPIFLANYFPISVVLIVGQELIWVMLFSLEEEWSTEYEDFTGFYICVLSDPCHCSSPLGSQRVTFSSSCNFINFLFPKPMKLIGSKVIRQKPKIKLLLKIFWVGASLEIDLISSPSCKYSFLL